MISFSSLLSTIITLFLLLVTGVFCGKTNIVDEKASKMLTNLFVKVGQPFLIINSIVSMEYSTENLKKGLMVLVLGLFIHALLSGLAWLICKPIRCKDSRKLAEFAMIYTNCGLIGFPILQSIFGAEGLFYGAFYIVSFHLLTWTWGTAILARGREDIKLTPKKALLNFGTVPCFIGFLLYVSRIPLPSAFLEFSSSLAAICTPLSIIITGANLARRSIKKMVTSPIVYYVNIMRLVVLPILVTTILWLIGIPDTFVVFGCVLAAMPSAAMVTVFGELYNINPGLGSEFVGSTSVLCTATLIPVISYAVWLVSL